MKRQVLTLVTVLSLLLLAGSAVAQTIHVRGDIPFNFIVGKHAFVAGQYEISSVGSGDSKTLLIRSVDGRENLFAQTNSTKSLQRADKTKLIFHRYGDRYFLAQVWVEGAAYGHQMQKSSRETEMASSYTKDSVIVLAQVR